MNIQLVSPKNCFSVLAPVAVALLLGACAEDDTTLSDVPDESATTTKQAYTTSEDMRPTDLTIDLVLASQPLHNNFTRNVLFTDHTGAIARVALDFVRTSALHYKGTVTVAGLTTLRTLVDQNNRSFWDKMSFENRGGTTPLDIATMEIWIEYAGHAGAWEPEMMIGYAANQDLAAGTDSFVVSTVTGRKRFAQEFLGWTATAFDGTPNAFKYFAYDIGKGGSDNDYPTNGNPKYGTAQALCSETVSWYYYTYGVRIQDTVSKAVYDFKDIDSHSTMHDQFKNSDRLYCYHLAAAAWVKRDRNYNWVTNSAGQFVTYAQPKAGDYLDRRPRTAEKDDGHAMMIAEWTPRTGSTGGEVTVIDGPYPVAYRTFNVHNDEASGTDYCVGRIPAND